MSGAIRSLLLMENGPAAILTSVLCGYLPCCLKILTVSPEFQQKTVFSSAIQTQINASVGGTLALHFGSFCQGESKGNLVS